MFISSILQRHPQEMGLQQELERLQHQLSELSTGKGHTGLIHYDFEIDNVFYVADEAHYCTIDFDDAMVHWFMMDITIAISDLQDGDEAGQKIRHFLAGYWSIKCLDERYLNLITVFKIFNDLYTYARLIRSVEDMDISTAPKWANQLKDKLLGKCEQIRKRYQPIVKLKPIDQDNWYACTQLVVTDEQKNVFPIPIVYWLAESAYCGFTPFALYTGEQLVGFAVYAVDPDDGSLWIMAFMIDHKFQHRGLGRSGMNELIRYINEKHICDKIMLGHRLENERAYNLYVSLGFQEVKRDEREVIRELVFSKYM